MADGAASQVDFARDGWAASQWFNSEEPPTLASLKGKVVVLHTFQMLCPGCVANGLPQAQKVHRLFPRTHVEVVGLHTVFEHHDAMGPVSLKAFIHENRLTFPIGVDVEDSFPLPRTMAHYKMRGTPSLLLFDREGSLRKHAFGQVDDMVLGADIMALMQEGPSPS
ncbi:MAG: TlpA family protein disulfide reductase [Alphaproteobacteria bacterium]|nr:TlpA family protein disulfide reductase [Alphaproteobacteria bacterium]